MHRLTRIVLVDDNEADNVFHEIMLRRAGFDGPLDVFDDPVQALSHLRALPPGPGCLVLLDINMPGLDGWQFLSAVEPVLGGETPLVVVMLTSSGSEDDRARAARTAAVRGYVTKPLDVEGARALLAGAWHIP